MLSSLKTLYQMVKDRPAPGFTKQRATSIVTAVLGIITTLGVLPALDKNKVLSLANITISVIFVVWGAAHAIVALFAAQHTTPVTDPRDNQGKPLVPAASSSAIVPVANVPAPIPVVENDPNPPVATDPSLLPATDSPVAAPADPVGLGAGEL